MERTYAPACFEDFRGHPNARELHRGEDVRGRPYTRERRRASSTFEPRPTRARSSKVEQCPRARAPPGLAESVSNARALGRSRRHGLPRGLAPGVAVAGPTRLYAPRWRAYDAVFLRTRLYPSTVTRPVFRCRDARGSRRTRTQPADRIGPTAEGAFRCLGADGGTSGHEHTRAVTGLREVSRRPAPCAPGAPGRPDGVGANGAACSTGDTTEGSALSAPATPLRASVVRAVVAVGDRALERLWRGRRGPPHEGECFIPSHPLSSLNRPPPQGRTKPLPSWALVSFVRFIPQGGEPLPQSTMLTVLTYTYIFENRL